MRGVNDACSGFAAEEDERDEEDFEPVGSKGWETVVSEGARIFARRYMARDDMPLDRFNKEEDLSTKL